MSKPGRVRGLLVNNLTLKLSSLVLATILWLHATTLQTYDDVQGVKLEIAGIPDSLVSMVPLPTRAEVAFRGKGDQLWWLFFRTPRVVLTVEDPRPGVAVLSLHPSNVHVPSGLDVQVSDVTAPRTIRIELDLLKRKVVPVIVETTGLPAPGYVRVNDRIVVDPAHVTLEGPSSVLDDLDGVRTEPMDISNVKGPVSRRLRLALPAAPHLTTPTEAVSVQALFERLIRQTIEAEPVLSRRLPEGWALEPETIRLHLWAPSSLEDSLRALDVAALGPALAIPRAPRDSAMLDVEVHPPSWVRQCTADPPRVLMRRVSPQ
ncbi:MAG: YbbR-like domain-containing protein [Candidatus Eisenbacteria bacterium]|jgi:hypothetical protein|nr:YbbR-like domain-containing protein [Candidatus Eisenbacteria bacterium]